VTVTAKWAVRLTAVGFQGASAGYALCFLLVSVS